MQFLITAITIILLVLLTFIVKGFSAFLGTKLLKYKTSSKENSIKYGIYITILNVLGATLAGLSLFLFHYVFFVVAIAWIISAFWVFGYIFKKDRIESIIGLFVTKLMEVCVGVVILLVIYSLLISFLGPVSNQNNDLGNLRLENFENYNQELQIDSNSQLNELVE